MRNHSTRQSIRSFVRVNHKIRAAQVRCLDPQGNMMGVIALGEALGRAEQLGLDVVEISPNADPPVCRIMDFGKFKYEQSRKEREARKHQHSADMKEI